MNRREILKLLGLTVASTGIVGRNIEANNLDLDASGPIEVKEKLGSAIKQSDISYGPYYINTSIEFVSPPPQQDEGETIDFYWCPDSLQITNYMDANLMNMQYMGSAVVVKGIASLRTYIGTVELSGPGRIIMVDKGMNAKVEFDIKPVILTLS